MIYDFSFFLFAGTAITGVIWLVDAIAFAPARRNNPHEYSSESLAVNRSSTDPVLVEYSKAFFPVLLVVFLLRGFVVEPFRIPSGSMIPTLYVGDFILVNKFSYGLRLPVLNKKVIGIGEPKRGDIMVFRYPRDPSTDYIKRVVGLPGDHIAYYNKVLYVNNKEVKKEYISNFTGPHESHDAREFIENLDGVKHPILQLPGRPGLNAEYIVPAGHYFMMGDNRDNSNDSRYWGVVADKYIVGRAFMIWMNFENWKVDWSRIGTILH